MATHEQRRSVRDVCEALISLNRALDGASAAGVFIELQPMAQIGRRNRTYMVSQSETREHVSPAEQS